MCRAILLVRHASLVPWQNLLIGTYFTEVVLVCMLWRGKLFRICVCQPWWVEEHNIVARHQRYIKYIVPNTNPLMRRLRQQRQATQGMRLSAVHAYHCCKWTAAKWYHTQ